ncbi:MAG TPA: ATP-binding protein [Candidatus Saccharimonadales bacterium]|nr:ATP-binding protein [Candidatus Saccharimonadales bacterium]
MGSSAILTNIAIKNFKLFRSSESFELAQGTYFIGTNNSGKTTALQAIRYFFDDNLYESGDFLNRTEANSRKTNSRTSEISVSFDLGGVNKKRLRETLVKKYGKSLTVAKLVKQTDTGVLEYRYRLNLVETDWDNLPPDVRELIQSIKVNYLHPQRGAELLEDAQIKLRRRLLDNWGRARAVTQSMRDLEEQWDSFRTTATQYLSDSLQANIQRVWPDGQVSIDLPRDIKDILAISDISFSGYKGAPSVDLLNQGSGAQSLILYFTHYMLDIDRTAHRAAEHHPIWLLEEPESFMHPDLISQFGTEINSSAWTDNIPLVVSTHSSILLSRSRMLGKDSFWHSLSQERGSVSKSSDQWTNAEIDDIGKLMGDSNFKFYFEAAKSNTTIYSEDERRETLDGLIRSGINVTKSVKGITKFKQMVNTLLALDKNILRSRMIVLVDNDDGFREIENIIETREIASRSQFKLFQVKELQGAFVIVLPDNYAAEDLYTELASRLDVVANEVFDANLKLKGSQSMDLSSLVTKFRHNNPRNREEALRIIRKHDEFKLRFWRTVDDKGWKVAPENVEAILKLISEAEKH